MSTVEAALPRAGEGALMGHPRSLIYLACQMNDCSAC